MQYIQSNQIAVTHAMLNRKNGFSAPPFASLNISYSVGDEPGKIDRNRQLIKNALSIDFLVTAAQVHSDNIFHTSKINHDTEVKGFDALLTNQRGVGLLIQQADCQAILMHDPINAAIAAVHCGWRGSIADIIGSTVAQMEGHYHTDPSQLRVAISPSLGPCCAEFINYTSELPPHFHSFQEKPNHFNFWEISKNQLEKAGIQPGHIDISGICTCCSEDYFSYRRATRKGSSLTGRQGSVICLPKK